MSLNIIQGNPTKTFFIEMITRDISIKDAILDLIDNSIDGANKINPNNYKGLFIDIIINKNEFIIKDNCGGFSLEIAQKYAFRFGRPDDAPKTGGSIGRFGVGMKRALFKIGQNFEVESKTENDHFQVDVDVKNWQNKKMLIKSTDDSELEVDDWSFSYIEIADTINNLAENGTYICVKNLNSEVSRFFGEDSFLNELEDDIERLLNFSIEKGISITLNSKELQKKGIVLFNYESKPYLFETTYNGVTIRVVAGLSYVGEPRTSGWYIYCNDRLVLEADKSEITAWGTSNIPKWHVDYVMFKGVMFFDSDETIKLPLTTTKKGIDVTSDVYQRALFYMREAMNAVLSFLKEVRKLGDEANDYRKLLGEQEDKISVIELKTLVISTLRHFTSPILDSDLIAEKKDSVRISYNEPREIAEKSKFHAQAKSYKELGEYTFNYYIKMEELTNE